MSSIDNYRPVAITCIISKVFELVILKRHVSLLETSSNQFGFKASHGTEHSIFIVKQVLDYYTSNGSPIYMCFLDLSKAFDRVNHSMLFKKLLGRHMPAIIVRILQTWYRTQTFVIKWNDCISSDFSVSNGVRQGGILSPMLFNVFIDDLSVILRHALYGCYINGECFNHIVYADDTVLIATSPVALQNMIDMCAEYFDKHSLVVNMKKTKCMSVLPKELKDIHVPTFYLHNSSILTVTSERYLGVFLSSKQSDDDSIQKEMRSMYSRGNVLLKKFRTCSDDVKTQLFKSYCSSFYCSSLWTSYKLSSLRALCVAYNNIFRCMFGFSRRDSVSQCFVFKDIPSFSVVRRKLMHSMYKRVLFSCNTLVKTVVDSTFFLTCKIFTEWISNLF